jgi:hypothetical protein
VSPCPTPDAAVELARSALAAYIDPSSGSFALQLLLAALAAVVVATRRSWLWIVHAVASPFRRRRASSGDPRKAHVAGDEPRRGD